MRLYVASLGKLKDGDMVSQHEAQLPLVMAEINSSGCLMEMMASQVPLEWVTAISNEL